jgi:hypothetical protein
MSSNWYTDNKQNRELERLSDQLAHASYETSSLRSRLAQVQGSLEKRVDKLAKAFDAFVELSDLRQELIGFADSAEVRGHAGRVLAALSSGTALPPPPREVPGYWLGPAVAVVQGLCAGEDVTAPLTEASARDERRTATFLCLALAALGRRTLVRSEWVEVAFGKVVADQAVSRVQRTLWEAAGGGALGEPGEQAMATLLQPALAGTDRSWTDVLATPTGAGWQSLGPGWTMPKLLDDNRINDQAKAATQLQRLRKAVEAIASDQSVLEPAVARADAGLDRGVPGTDEPQSLVDVLRLVIGEGSPAERDVLSRVAELRAELSGESPGSGSVDEAAGTFDDLLAADLKGENGAHLAAFGLRLVAPSVLAGAEELSAKASSDLPAWLEVRVGSQNVKVGRNGPEPRSLSEAEARLRVAGQPESEPWWRSGLVVLIVGLVAAVGLFFLHWFWSVIALGVAGFGLKSMLSERGMEREMLADLETRVATLHQTSTEASQELSRYAEQRPARTDKATEELAGVRTALDG